MNAAMNVKMMQLNSWRSAVATKRWVLFLLTVAMLSVLAACGGSTANVQNPPPPPPPNVTVTVQTSASSISVGGAVSLTATIQGPSGIVADGVAWTLTCQNGSGSICGTLSSPSSQSGTPITFTAPSTLSTNSMVTEIVAYAEGDQTVNEVSPITITTFNSSLIAGTYILQAHGVDSNNDPYQIAAALVFDGQGNIKNGEQTANYLATGSLSDTNLSGTYFLGNDGRGLITVNTNDSNIGGNGIETFPIVFLNNSSQNPQALVSQVDIENVSFTGDSAVGTLDLQETTVVAPTGSYAFVMQGTNVVQSLPFALGGVLNIPSGQSAVSGVFDEIISEHLRQSDAAFLTGSQLSSGPDAFGQVTVNLAGLLDGIHPKTVTAVVTGYIIDTTHIDLIETDSTTGGSILPLGLTGGLALGQTGGSYGTFNNASFSGPYVFGVTGVDLSPLDSSFTPATWTSADIFTADGNGCQSASCSGYADTFLLDNCVQSTCKKGGITGAQISAQFTGTYAVDSSTSSCGATSGTVVTGTGRACVTPNSITPGPDPTYEPELFIYLTNPTTASEALVLGMGDIGSQPALHYPSIGTGIAYPQSTQSATFSGDYGLSFTQQNGIENDGTGQMNANSSALSGFADSSTDNGIYPTLPDQPFQGTFNSPSASAPFPGTLENVNAGAPFNVTNTITNAFSVDYFFIDPTQGFFIETDLVTQQSAQVSFGYYAARTPLCSGCPSQNHETNKNRKSHGEKPKIK
jgi:hypothetical protein